MNCLLLLNSVNLSAAVFLALLGHLSPKVSDALIDSMSVSVSMSAASSSLPNAHMKVGGACH